MNQHMVERAATAHVHGSKTGLPAAGTYVVALLISLLYVVPTLTRNGDRRILWLFSLAVITLLLVRIWTVAALFVLVQLKLALRDTPRGLSLLRDDELLFGIGVLAMVIAGSRLVVLLAPMVPNDTTIFGLFRALARQLAADARADRTVVMPTRHGATFSATEVVTGMARAIAAVLVAALLLGKFPLDPTTIERMVLFDWAVRSITISVVLILIYQVTNAVLGTICWRRLTPPEARVHLRSELVNGTHSEVRVAVTQQIKQLRKESRRPE